jgi:serine/threonine-protein kinase SRPK3
MSFPEEPLDLPPSEGGGYYPATIHQKLNVGRLEVVRKLGYGPRSSVWLVWDGEDYFTVKIYTIAASEHAKTVELPILKVVHDLDASIRLPTYHDKFWEKTTAGSHLCLVLNPMSTTVRALQHDANHERLPVHAVQNIVLTVADALECLHSVGIMHGGTKSIFSS